MRPDSLAATLIDQLGEVPAPSRESLAREVRSSFEPAGISLGEDLDTSESLVVIDLAPWPMGARIELEEVLQIRNLEHVWEGSKLLIPDRLEYSFDEEVSELHATAIAEAGSVEGQSAAGGSTGEPETTVRIDLSEWAPETVVLLEYTLAGQWSLFETAWAPLLSQAGTAATFGFSAPWVPHAWDGRVLVVREADADSVGAIVSAIQNQALLALDESVDMLAYDLDDLDDDALGALLANLIEQGIPHRMSRGYELFIHETDEDKVEEILDEVDNPDELDAEADGTDGLEAMRLLSELFVASDRLYKDGRNADGILDFFAAADSIAAVSLPYGFSEKGWKGIADAIAEVRSRLEADDARLEHIEEAAEALREILLPIV